jgi:hypothetical protein
MKRITTLLLAASSVTFMKAQVVFQENFTSPFNPVTNGWSVQNLSASANPTLAWFQGNGTQTFPAFNGGPNDYYAVNFQNTTSGSPITISSWLITPTLNLVNGGVIEFATRTTTNPATNPDRLELYMSTAGAGVNVGASPTSVGTFSTLLVSVNPNLTTTGYPGSWTVYSATLSGLAGPVLGRFGFRYHVTGASTAASGNADYIGVDAVKYSLACNVTLNSYTTCSGQSLTLTANGGGTNTTYTWSPGGSNASSMVVNPSSTTVYTLTYEESLQACPDVTSTITIGSQLGVSIQSSTTTICSGRTVTLTGVSTPNTSYLWGTAGGSTPLGSVQTITVAPTSTTTYTLGGLSGACAGQASVTINTLPNPTLSYASTATLANLCPNQSITLTGNGASTYTWVIGSLGFTNNPLPITTGTNPAGGSFTIILVGTNSVGCTAAGAITGTINPSPTVAVTAKTLECINKTLTISATGATSYTWTGDKATNAPSFTFATGNTATTHDFSVTGTNAAGCQSTLTAISVSVSLCTGIAKIDDTQKASVYPNPFSNELRVFDLTGSVEVYNTLGQMLIREQVNGEKTISTTDLPKGTYIIKAYDADGDAIKHTSLIKN